MRIPLAVKVAVPLVVVVVAGVLALVFVPRALGQGSPLLEQPFTFPHNTHVTEVGLACAFCHRTAISQAPAGIPAVEQCMFCHSVVPTGVPEMERRRDEFLKGDPVEPINWVRVHRLPDHVHFIHEPHVRAGLDCATCHGNVGKVSQVTQVRSLRMGDCLGCHRSRNVNTDCSICHY